MAKKKDKPQLPHPVKEPSMMTAYRLGASTVASLRTICKICKTSTQTSALQISVEYYKNNLPDLYAIIDAKTVEKIYQQELEIVKNFIAKPKKKRLKKTKKL